MIRGRAYRLIAVALVGGLMNFLPPERAEANLDPLRIVTSQIVPPNILIALDTSGSLSERPETSDWPNDVVGGDCYQGRDCNPNPMSGNCSTGLTCSQSNTCADGSPCVSGTNSYCASGAACVQGRLCGTSPSQTLCPTTQNTCRDGTLCWNQCTDGATACHTTADCPAPRCNGEICLDGTTCTATGGCTTSRACIAGKCNTQPSKSCNNQNQCPQNACQSGTCSNNGSVSCTVDSQCGTNTCNTSVLACPGSTGSTACGLWCSVGGALCTAVQSYCQSSSGTISSCTQQCSDGGTCYTQSHCGTASCPSTSYAYKGSSRMAIAKHVLTEIVSASKNVANFGLMAFNQTQYFPYKSGGTVQTLTEYFTRGQLNDNNGWDLLTFAPAASFVKKGVTYTLLATGGTGNSKYANRGSRADHDYCGNYCTFAGQTWSYKGSYYTYTKTTASSSGSVVYQSTYQGASVSVSGTTYNYYSFPWDYSYNLGSCGSSTGPVCGWQGSGSSCSDSSKSDGALRVAISTSSSDLVQEANALAIEDWLRPQVAGGLVAQGGTPTGCFMQYASSGSAPSSVGSTHDVYSYLSSLKTGDALNACRRNYVILVTDGEPNGPGDDSTCDSSACSVSPLSGCTCKSVLAAYNLYQNLGVRTYVVGFGAGTAGSAVLDNVATVGNTCHGTAHCAYQANDEQSLTDALFAAVYDAVKGDYATSPPTIGTSTSSTYAGDIALLASTEFPSWKGHLRAFDVVHKTGGVPTLLWDAGQVMAGRTWTQRKVYTSDPANQHALVPFLTSAGAPNAAALFALGLGGSQAEATSIIQFALGLNRSWPLGAFLNSTPVSVGKAIDINLPGHVDYNAAHQGQVKMVYAGADDVMLHAFYLEGASGGQEVWAYVPPDQLSDLARLLSTSGQPTDPGAHVYGMANSPHVNDVCQGTCSTANDWRTVLVTGEGAGGTAYFALDITSGQAQPFKVLWNTGDSTSFQQTAGNSWSVPAFTFYQNGSGSLASMILFGSGYDPNTNDSYAQGRYLFRIHPMTGAPAVAAFQMAPPSSGLIATYAVLADTVIARDQATWRAVAAYQADLAGRIWRFNNADGTPSAPFYDLGPTHPFFYSPAVTVQTGRTVALAAVDSTFDDADVNGASSVVPNISILIDQDGLLASNHIFTAPLTSICKDSCHLRNCSSCPKFSATARPVTSPILLTNTDSQATASFQALFLIYQPSGDSCSLGSTSLVVMDVIGDPSPVIQSEAKAMPGNGKSAGLFIGAGGEVLVGTSGAGSAPSAVQVVAGSPVVTPPSWSTTLSARLVGIAEK